MHTEQHPCKSMQATKARRKNARSIAAAKQKHFLANFSNRKTEVDKSTNRSAPRKSLALNQNPKPLNPRTENSRHKRSLIFRGMQERSAASKAQVDPESKQKWGGDLCTKGICHPTERSRSPKKCEM